MVDKYNITYYTDFLLNLKNEYGSSNDVCSTFNVGIKQHIDDINSKNNNLSSVDWDDIAKVAMSNIQDAKYLAIYMIENVLCPISVVRNIADKTTDSDVLVACLSREIDARRIPYLVNSINPDKLLKIARRAEYDNEPPMFTAVALDYLATECGNKFNDIFLMFAHNKDDIERMEKVNGGFTERQATYILKNLLMPDTFKRKIYEEYGCDFTAINENVSEKVCDDIFLSACQTVFELRDVDKNTRENAEATIQFLQDKKLISNNAQTKFIKWFEDDKNHYSAALHQTMKDIALTTESGIVYGLLNHPLKYRNPIASLSSLSIALLEGIETLSNALSDRAFKETAQYISDKILYQNPVSEDNLNKLYEFIKLSDKTKKEMMSDIAKVIVVNPQINTKIRSRFAKLYKKDLMIQALDGITTDLKNGGLDIIEINYIMECILRKNDYITKDPTNYIPDVYISDKKTQYLKDSIDKWHILSNDVSLTIRRGFSVLEYERQSERFYKEHNGLFAPASDYDLRSSNGKTLHILKLDRKTDEELKQKYSEFDINELKKMKNLIYSAVSYQDKKSNIYEWLDKYVRQYNIVNDVILKKEKEVEINEREIVKKLENIFDR